MAMVVIGGNHRDTGIKSKRRVVFLVPANRPGISGHRQSRTGGSLGCRRGIAHHGRRPGRQTDRKGYRERQTHAAGQVILANNIIGVAPARHTAQRRIMDIISGGAEGCAVAIAKASSCAVLARNCPDRRNRKHHIRHALRGIRGIGNHGRHGHAGLL